ncbi:unnamed protein product [Paramecium sonneborni]|uniref:Zinc finger PHD-type domain-containing protein n=1 Tax=Paramecium sonneborni TaxID=65129 RepID=A0A8S1QT21_9CILI|nr:unnamed protein product [Paramecium sonneborni]
MKKKDKKNKKHQNNKQSYPNFMKMIEERNFDDFISSFRDFHPTNVCQCAFIYTYKPQEKLSIDEDAVFVYDNKIWFVRVEEIIKIVINGEEAGFIKGRIYLQKQDVLQLHEKIQECTDDDLFLTEQTKWFFSRELKQKILVYNLNDIIYNNVDSKPGSYYTRSEFNTESQMFLTPIEEWATECVCKKLFDNSLGYLQCDRCERWIHNDCSGLSQEVLENMGDLNFNCSICVGEMKIEKIKQKQVDDKKQKTGVSTNNDKENKENQIVEENLQIQKQDRKPLLTKKLLDQNPYRKQILNLMNFKKPTQKMKSK